MDYSKLGNDLKSTTKHTRQFNGPSDKKHYYVTEFISLIRESDPDHLEFTKGDLMEASNALRKAVSTNPTLFRLIQAIVDEGTFVDGKVLQLMETDEKNLPDITEGTFRRLENDLAVQNRLKHLAQFNSVQMSNKLKNAKIDESPITPKGPTNELERCKLIHEQIGDVISKSILSKPFDTIALKAYFKNTINSTQFYLTNFNRLMGDAERVFKFKMIDTDQLVNNLIFSNNAKLSADQIFEQNQECKKRFFILQCLLSDLRDTLSQLEKEISFYLTHQEIVSLLTAIKNNEDQLYSVLISCQLGNKQEPIRIIDFLKKHQPDLNIDRLFSALHRLENKIIVNQDKLKKLQPE